MNNAFTIPKTSDIARTLQMDAYKKRTDPKEIRPINLPGSSKFLPPAMMWKANSKQPR